MFSNTDTTADLVDITDERTRGPRWVVFLFILGPLLALLVGLPLALRGWISWLDVTLAAIFYLISATGITMGFHRLFTHSSFKANAPLRATLAIAGSLAIQGSCADWVADHRKHHSKSDKEGDPHSPWQYGTSTRAVAKGFWHAHMGWMLAGDVTDVNKYAPDLLKDPVINRISRAFPLLVLATFLVPALLGGLLTMSWQGALSALFWAGLVRVALVHQITWSINSICHIAGQRPFRTRDHSGNVAWLAVPALGESWHNYHHADPTSARHGVLRRQLDPSAWAIRFCERRGWASRVHWPSEERVRSKLVDPEQSVEINRTLIEAHSEDVKAPTP